MRSACASTPASSSASASSAATGSAVAAADCRVAASSRSAIPAVDSAQVSRSVGLAPAGGGSSARIVRSASTCRTMCTTSSLTSQPGSPDGALHCSSPNSPTAART